MFSGARCLIRLMQLGPLVWVDVISLHCSRQLITPALSPMTHASAAKQVGDTGSPTVEPSALSCAIKHSGYNWLNYPYYSFTTPAKLGRQDL
eukprot:11869002-Karenia_brevis.AAC.1